MGKSSKARRDAKAKVRAKARGRQHATDDSGRATGDRGRSTGDRGRSAGDSWRPPPADEPLFTQAEVAHALMLQIAIAERRGREVIPGAFARLLDIPARVVDRQAELALLDQVDALWANGWQPAELLRQARRGCHSSPAARLVASAIANDDAGRPASTLDPRWREQVDGLALPPADGRPGWVSRWAADEGLDRTGTLAAVIDALGCVMAVPPLDPLLPPPGAGASSAAAGHGWKRQAAADPVLERVRNLLAKAESTTFEAEAASFTAKAQELMTRHAIDLAMVAGSASGPSDGPVAIRVPVDPPYADAKSLLLQTVAEAGRCRAVFHPTLALSTVVGLPDDVAAVEVLFTSLLVQAQTALTEAAKGAPPGTRTRGQSYRSAFLLAFTDRIAERLDEINQHVFAEVEATKGGSFLPVLRSQADAVDDFVEERFGRLRSSRVRGGYDMAGWSHGQVAADSARLTFGDLATGD